MQIKSFRYGALVLLTLAILGGFLARPVQAQSGQPLVVVLNATGAVVPGMVSYLERGLETAAQRGAALVVIQLNTPGGSIDVMNSIIMIIEDSRVPVVVYVGPRGAMAGSAGTLITLSGQVAAMAPQTTIGAASPVGSNGEDIGQTMERKIKEILKATVRNLARNRPPEAIQLAEATIESAQAATADEALRIGLVDIIAVDVPDLLRQLEGRTVQLDGQSVRLSLAGAEVQIIDISAVEDLLQRLINPDIVFLLLALGIMAILIELSSPGGWVAGFLGVISLLVASYGLGVLPINWMGFLFMAVAFALFILEIKAPTQGALILAGAASFIVGGLILFNTSSLPGFPPVSVPLVVGTGIFIAGLFFVMVTYALRFRRIPLSMGQETIIGKEGVVRVALNPRGQVQLTGELWSAEPVDGTPVIGVGTRVMVVETRGVRLIVRPVE